MISSEVRESRLPVGSSASSTVGRGHKRARNRHALLLTAGQLARMVIDARAETHALQRTLRGARVSRCRPERSYEQWQLHVLERARAREQIETLEHETELLIARVRELVLD